MKKAEKIDTVGGNDLENDDSETLLFIAVKTVNLEVLKLLTEAGTDVNVQDTFGQTPLLLALKCIHADVKFRRVINILCNSNAKIHLQDKSGMSPAKFVANNHDPAYDFLHALFLKIVHRECGYDSETTAKKLFDLNYPFYRVVELRNAKVIDHMISHGCPVDICHPVKRFTALTRAVQMMDLQTVEVLIKRGADVDIVDSKHRLPIEYYGSGKIREPAIIEILIMRKIRQADEVFFFNDRYVEKAFEYGNCKVVRIMLQHVGTRHRIQRGGTVPLHWLARNPHSDVTDELRGREINVNVRDNLGRTPLHHAAKCPYSHANTFRFLLENDADPNARDSRGWIPMFDLCENRSTSSEQFCRIVEMLLEYGSDVRIVGELGTTIFHVVANGPLIQHLAMMDEMKKPVAQGIRMYIDGNKNLKFFFESCKVEIAKMKGKFVNKKLTLYAIVVGQMSDEEVVKSCRFSANAMSNLEKLKNAFQPQHCYYSLVQKRISSVMSKLELFRKASLVVCKLLRLGNNPYHIIVTEIMGYLDNEDHENLVEI